MEMGKGAAAAKGVCGVQGCGWEKSGSIVGALFVEGATVSLRESGVNRHYHSSSTFLTNPDHGILTRGVP